MARSGYKDFKGGKVVDCGFLPEARLREYIDWFFEANRLKELAETGVYFGARTLGDATTAGFSHLGSIARSGTSLVERTGVLKGLCPLMSESARLAVGMTTPVAFRMGGETVEYGLDGLVLDGAPSEWENY